MNESSNFSVGDKVVCVRGNDTFVLPPLVEGAVYVVRETDLSLDRTETHFGPSVFLVGIPDVIFEEQRWAYCASRFRLLSDLRAESHLHQQVKKFIEERNHANNE